MATDDGTVPDALLQASGCLDAVVGTRTALYKCSAGTWSENKFGCCDERLVQTDVELGRASLLDLTGLESGS